MPGQKIMLNQHSINYFLTRPFGNVIPNKTRADLFQSLIPNGMIVNTFHIPNMSTWLEPDCPNRGTVCSEGGNTTATDSHGGDG